MYLCSVWRVPNVNWELTVTNAVLQKTLCELKKWFLNCKETNMPWICFFFLRIRPFCIHWNNYIKTLHIEQKLALYCITNKYQNYGILLKQHIPCTWIDISSVHCPYILLAIKKYIYANFLGCSYVVLRIVYNVGLYISCNVVPYLS